MRTLITALCLVAACAGDRAGLEIGGEPAELTRLEQRTFGCCQGTRFVVHFGNEQLLLPMLDWDPDESDSLRCPLDDPADPRGLEMARFELGELTAANADCSGRITWGSEREVVVDGAVRLARDVDVDLSVELAGSGGESLAVAIDGVYRVFLASL